MRLRRALGLATWIAMGIVSLASAVQTTTLDDFEQLTDWTTAASDGANVWLSQDTGRSGFALRVDFARVQFAPRRR